MLPSDFAYQQEKPTGLSGAVSQRRQSRDAQLYTKHNNACFSLIIQREARLEEMTLYAP